MVVIHTDIEWCVLLVHSIDGLGADEDAAIVEGERHILRALFERVGNLMQRIVELNHLV